MSTSPSKRRSPARNKAALAPVTAPLSAASKSATDAVAVVAPAAPASRARPGRKAAPAAAADASVPLDSTGESPEKNGSKSRTGKNAGKNTGKAGAPAKPAAVSEPAEAPAPRQRRSRAQAKPEPEVAQVQPVAVEPVADAVADEAPVQDVVTDLPPAVASEPARARKRPARQKPAPVAEAMAAGEPAAVSAVALPQPPAMPDAAPQPEPAGEPLASADAAELPQPAAKPARARGGRSRGKSVDMVTQTVVDAAPAVTEPPRFSQGPREEVGVFGDHELRDGLTGATLRLRVLGRQSWRCDCVAFTAQGQCEHGDALLALWDEAALAALDAGWPAREAEVWLRPGVERGLQWVAGTAVPDELRYPEDLDETGSLPAEYASDWLQQRLVDARALGVALRVDAQVWPQLAWARDAQARVQRVERAMTEQGGLSRLLQDTLPAYQWEAALFAVCAGRALLADDLGLGQRGAAVAALQLWRQLFAAEPAMIVAPVHSHPAWQRELQRWLGEVPRTVLLVSPEQVSAPRQTPALLVVDGVDDLSAEQLSALRGLEALHLLLIAHREPLGDARLGDWVDWLDLARRGPLARLQALGDGASKKLQREALATVLLSRRQRELDASLPAALLQPLWLDAAGAQLPLAPLKQLRQWVQRWQQLGYLSSAEQQQLLQALALLPPASRQVLAAKAEALLQLRRDWLESATPAAPRLLVVARSETLLDSLAQAPQLRRLPLQRLRAGDESSQRAALLQAWRSAPAGLLLASDDALATLVQGELVGDRAALVHADLPWESARLGRRLAQASGEQARGVPTALLLTKGSLDESLWAAQRAGASLPDWLDQAPQWLTPEQLQQLLPALTLALPDLLSD